MIRFIHCMKKRPELTTAEFREYWNGNEFADLISQMSDIVGPVTIIKNLTFNIELNNALREARGADEPYDGIMEIWIESAADLKQLETDEAKQVVSEMETYQKQFVDFAASKRFFTEWEPTGGLG
ncbi:MAG: EthD domain-containing protein [Gammaproteobacteria bacterium]|nr:EthD domain-containing protein [Gammaproteobacteria bacterium]